MSQIIGSIITDCADDNARTRQELRFSSLFGVAPSFFGLGAEAPDIEAAGNLINQLDALGNLPASMPETAAVMLVNVAPRGDKVREEWGNGTPFCFCRIGNALVFSTYVGNSLGLAQSLGLVESVELMDVPTVTKAAVAWGELTEAQAERINHTQFRSLEFLPLAAYWLTQGRPVPSVTKPLHSAADLRGKVWFIDNFGNAKTTLLSQDVAFEEGKMVTLADGRTASCIRRLADVPKDASALIVGSSGYGDKRFLEVVVQWHDGGFHGSNTAASRHGYKIGSEVLQS